MPIAIEISNVKCFVMRYGDTEKIGSGGFGEVWKTVREEDGTEYAKKRFLETPFSTDTDKERFKREVRLLRRLDHPRIVKVVGVHLNTDPLWFVMPLYHTSLFDILEDVSSNKSRACAIFVQILEGIEYAHQNGVIHRDLKPENVLLDDRDHAVVSDFGLGRDLESNSTRKTSVGKPMGTYNYMPPEQLTNSREVDRRADVYALGRILYDILTGDIDSTQVDLDALEPAFRQIVRKCMRSNPEERYDSVADLRADMTLATSEGIRSDDKSELRKLQEVLVADDTPDESTIDRFVEILIDLREDTDTLHDAVLSISSKVFEVAVERHASEMRSLVKAFCSHVEASGWPFDYCDTIAHRVERLYSATSDVEIRASFICCLLELGHSHNRWLVQNKVARLIGSIDNVAEVIAVRDALVAYGAMLKGLKDKLLGHDPPAKLRELIERS